MFSKTIFPILSIVMLMLSTHGSASAGPPVFSVDSADEKLIVRGVLDGKKDSFSGNVRFLLKGADAKELCLLPSDFRHTENPSVMIDRSRIAIPSGVALFDGRPKDVTVTISDLPGPGTYEGKLEFYLPDLPDTRSAVVNASVIVKAVPKVVSPVESATIRVAAPKYPGDDLLAMLLLPDSMTRDQWTVHLDNLTATPVEVADSSIFLRGESNAFVLGKNEIALNAPDKLAASEMAVSKLAIPRDDIPPDRYVGRLRFRFEGSDDPLDIPLVMEVRTGPLVPLLAILLGIVAGRLVRDSESPEAKTQAKFFPSIYQLKASARSILDPASGDFAEKRVKDFKERLEKGGVSEEDLARELDQLEEQIAVLRGLDDLEKQIEDVDGSLAEEIRQDLEEARNAVRKNDMEKAEQCRETIEESLKEAAAKEERRTGTLGGRAALRGGTARKPYLTNAMNLVARIRVAPEMLERDSGKGKAPDRGAWIAATLAFLAGSSSVKAEIRFWLVRPLLYLLLLALLTLVGLETLYIKGGATFGASGLYDFLGLFMWGLGADVAQRTLQNLKGNK